MGLYFKKLLNYLPVFHPENFKYLQRNYLCNHGMSCLIYMKLNYSVNKRPTHHLT